MRCTERCLELAGAALACAAVIVTAPLASCVLDQTTFTPSADDISDSGSGDASPPADDASVVDAPSARFDATPPAPSVVCRSAGPCALSVRAPTSGAGGPVADAFCALLSSGKVACWGSNLRGELGRAATDGEARSEVGFPGFVDGLADAKELDRGCALRGDASIACWGQVVVPGVSDGTSPLAGLTKLPIPPAKKISIAGQIGCALLSNDHVSCWGVPSSSGQLTYAGAASGEGGVVGPSEVPLPEGRRIVGVFVGEPTSGAGGATYALRDDGTALSWGMNQSLGRVSSLVPDPFPGVVELAGVRSVSAGGASACAIAGGAVSCWGADLGAPKTVGVYDPIHVATVGPRQLGRGCAVQRNGDVHCWGDNDTGQAGDGTIAAAPFPVKVAGLPAAAISVEVTWKTTCAVLVDGRVFCWGDGVRGQLGRVFIDGYSTEPLEVVLPEGP